MKELLYQWAANDEYYIFKLFAAPYILILILACINQMRIKGIIRSAEREGRVVKAYLKEYSGSGDSGGREDLSGVATYVYKFKDEKREFRMSRNSRASTNGIIPLYHAPGSGKMYSKQQRWGGDVMILIPVVFAIELVIILVSILR